ncbi:uncharacterized protein LOC129568454 isoform X1 [Sitodiplosis mosellana]|uniref:uncharacterized protein LOC129568454 isoform X1 n=1 Tax=Sitodiplosis mosellana TaxID=263140 RepID=UPI002444CB86|nr:uncharacterized protein LOC129568454 isoform X1 [Sitodiplosis mosellana]XP_055302340.1 uncharacterized protein LOC129568454 isoform X1 [Sitodiplosis mosellana]
MSHANVTVTRTVVTSNPSTIVINTGYLKTSNGLLKLLQLILGGVAVGLLLKNFDDYPYFTYRNGIQYYQNYPNFPHLVPVLLLLLAATVFSILTAILLLSCIFSLSTGGLISKTLYEFLYHLVAAILLLIASILLYAKIHNLEYLLKFYKWFLAATILCFVNSLLYLASTVLAFRDYRK